MTHDVLVLGAGIAGLRCAKELTARGADVLVLDRADKPGGRCATRTFSAAVADYGPLFVHGSDPAFLAAARAAAPGAIVEGWPARVQGEGRPCQPDAFARGESRFALREGMNAFARSISGGLAIRLLTQVERVQAAGGLVTAHDAHGEAFQARDLVLALALEQAVPFLRALGPGRSVEGGLALLDLFASVPCLTVIAGYPEGTRLPAWDILYPADDPVLLLVSNESSKRGGPPVLLIQAAPRWSRARMADDKERWADDLVAAAARVVAPWAAATSWRHAHRWRHARVERANELRAPLVMDAGGARIGVCGEIFSPGGGMQAAWQSGGALAHRLGR
jgi:renalase